MASAATAAQALADALASQARTVDYDAQATGDTAAADAAAKGAAGDARSAAATAREVADQEAKARADAAQAAGDRQDLVHTGGATGIQRVFTQQSVTQLGTRGRTARACSE
ncbi:hypothetical protein [Kitasatospora griseola]|uniref:hypothetical protein n=1 Tax=Kitasatospora griseola TaxID=2064 RepID=UPI003822EFD9